MAPAARLAEEIGVSPPTAKAWLDSLKKERVYVGVQAILNPIRLGLQVYDFLVETGSHDDLVRIEQFCEEHPYTLYRARVYGGSTHGLLLQFRQPPETQKHLERAFKKLKEHGLVERVRELPTLLPGYCSTYTHPKPEAWDSERLTWNFDWDRWWNTPPSHVRFNGETVYDKPQDVIDIDGLDAKILEEITMDARRKNTEIMDKIGLDKNERGVPQMFSKRLKRLQEIIETYTVFINWTHFDVYSTSMIIAKAPPEVTQRLIAKLGEGDFPFASSIREISTGFVWSARMPSAHMSEMITLVWKICESFELLTIDYKYSQRYGLWAETFDEATRSWRADEDFTLNKPLKHIGID